MREQGSNDTLTATVHRPSIRPSGVRRRPTSPFRPPTGAPVAGRPAPAAVSTDTGSIIDQHRAAPPVTITHETSIVGAPAEALWEAYFRSFAPLETRAVLQHLYTRDEMFEEFANPRIRKIVGWQDGEPVGLAMVTNSLEDVPQISPVFLRSKYPDHAARDAIYFGILVMVTPGARRLTLLSRLSVEVCQAAAQAGGVLVWDLCEYNREAFDTERVMARIVHNFPRSSMGVLDRQTWYVAELPEPIADSRVR
jgi:hypothetical protein